ncbi:MAG: response regulator [Planctomycetes bacterium]|nr:response regulator [Planctomycetota bacterium]
MTKRVLDVGNCSPDFAAISRFLTANFDCQVDQAHGPDDTLAELRKGDYALVLINRKLDRDYSDGIEILKQLKADSELQSVPVMLVTNLSEHQDAAVAVGAERGFGKLELEKPETLDLLKPFLEEQDD